MKRVWHILFLVLLPFCADVRADSFVQNDMLSQSGGISEGSPNSTSSQLNYQICNSTNSDQQSLFRIDIIGSGPNQVPAGSTITSATLRQKAEIGGDGLLYRAGEVWDAIPTWNELGDVMIVGSSIGVGQNTGQSQEFDVTSHIQLWSDGTSNQGWVIKGAISDCQAARIYNGTASSSNRPRLTVIFVPPDTTSPRVSNVTISNGTTTYNVPTGSGEQMRTVPIAMPNKVIVTFNEDVANTVGNISVKSAITNVIYGGTVTYNSGTHQATLTLSSNITSPDILILTVTNSVTDLAGNVLDSEWSNPTALGSTGTSAFPSGNGAAGSAAGAFKFNFAVLPGDYNRNNVGDAAYYVLWRYYYGTLSGATFSMGDGDADGDVDNGDYNIYRFSFGYDYIIW